MHLPGIRDQCNVSELLIYPYQTILIYLNVFLISHILFSH